MAAVGVERVQNLLGLGGRADGGGRIRWPFVARGLALGLAAVGVVEAVLVANAVAGGWYGGVGSDLDPYLVFTRTWLASGNFYQPAQLAGPYSVEALTANVYPPTLLYLTVPFAVGLPVVLWWVLPLGLIAAAIRACRPAWWGLPGIGFALACPRVWTILVAGNPAMWAIAFGLAGVAWGWPGPFAAVKTTFAPLALVGLGHRVWWRGVVIALALCVPFGAMWVDYAHVLLNARSDRGLVYVLGEWPVALGLLWAAASGPLSRRGTQAGR